MVKTNVRKRKCIFCQAPVQQNSQDCVYEVTYTSPSVPEDFDSMLVDSMLVDFACNHPVKSHYLMSHRLDAKTTELKGILRVSLN